MPLSLTKRATKGSPLTVLEHDTNLSDIETLTNSLETYVGTKDVPAMDTRLTTAEAEVDVLQTDLDAAEVTILNHETRVTANDAHRTQQSGNPHAVSKSDIGLGNVTNDAQLKRAAADFASFTEKAAPVANDLVLIEDSAAANAKKKAKLSSLPVNSHTHDNSDLTEIPAYQAGDALSVLRVNSSEDALEFAPVTATDADTVDGYHASSLMGGFKNKLINPGFTINQREVAAVTSASGFAVDRWKFTFASVTSTSMSREAFTVGQTTVPGNPKYYLRTVLSGSDAAAAAALLDQTIGGVEQLSGKTVTLSFWAKASAAGLKLRIRTDQVVSTGVYTRTEYDIITLTASWAKYTATFTLPSISGQTVVEKENYTNLRFWMSQGTTYNWTDAQGVGAQDGTLDIAQIQLEEGSVATDFEDRRIGGLELALCQRYYWRGAAKSDYGYRYHATAQAFAAAGNVTFPVQMRVWPTMSTVTAPTYSNCSGCNLDAAGEWGFAVRVQVTAAGSYRASGGVYAADAEF